MPNQDNTFASRAVPEVQNKAPKAPGIMPKNAQTWAIVGISAVMITVIAFSNSGTPKAKPKPIVAEQQNAIPPNQRQVDQYRAMVDEEARKLALERRRLDQAKLDAENAAMDAQFGSLPGGLPPAGYHTAPIATSGSREQSPEEAQKLALEAERKKREYLSLFSSNVSLSFRKDQNAQQPGNQPQELTALPTLQAIGAQLNALRGGLVNNSANATTVPQTASSAATALDQHRGASSETEPASAASSPVARRKAQAEDPSLQRAEGKKYRLFEGTVLETVLTNRLNGSFSGPVNVMLTTSVYSHDHQQLLIPQGSRVLGEVAKVNSFGQQRLAVFFHRLIMPDGYSISLDQFHGLNQIGETGLRDQVNHHYLQVFGVSLAIGAIAGIEQAGSNYGYSAGGVDAYRRGVSESLSQSALRILDRYLNILPTLTVREGHRVKVFLSDDLMLPAYERHGMPTNL
jgi:type IV secretion system protein TrbI